MYGGSEIGWVGRAKGKATKFYGNVGLYDLCPLSFKLSHIRYLYAEIRQIIEILLGILNEEKKNHNHLAVEPKFQVCLGHFQIEAGLMNMKAGILDGMLKSDQNCYSLHIQIKSVRGCDCTPAAAVVNKPCKTSDNFCQKLHLFNRK